jgi:hypothetical protein
LANADSVYSFTGPVVKVIVENGKVAFNIHEKILRDSSEFFDKALSGTWKEATERTVEMPLDEAEIFEMYAQWLYTSTLPDVLKDTSDDGPDYLPFAKAWVFGDKVLDSRFRNTIIDAIMENELERDEIVERGWYWTPGDPVIPYIYNNTTRESPLRRLLLDISVRECDDDWLWGLKQEEVEEIPHLFLLELSQKLLDQVDFRVWDELNTADYYCGMASDGMDV